MKTTIQNKMQIGFKHKWSQLMILLFMAFIFSSCEEFIQINPPENQIIKSAVFSDDATALSSIRGIYAEMARISAFSGASTSVALFAGTSADELIDLSTGVERVQFFTNSLIPTNTILVSSLWAPMYKFIYYSNSVIEGLVNANNVSLPIKNLLEGESKFIRAFSYFYLINLFGDVPLIRETDYRVNSKASRVAMSTVYQQIISDLQDAQNLLPADYSHADGKRTRPNRWAATALLARVYLFIQDWNNAEIQATALINNTDLYALEADLSKVFLANSLEAIWQLMPVEPGYNTNEANSFMPRPGGSNDIVALTTDLINAFEQGDSRTTNWTTSMIFSGTTYYYAHKYKVQEFGLPLTEYSMVIRLAELYLIRAEARAQQNKLTEAISDLDIIRQRAELPLIQSTNPSISMVDLLLAIEQEKRIELFSEWGHRWLDLKRTGRVETILGQVKTGWQLSDALYPIPQSERNNNPNLSQNLGY